MNETGEIEFLLIEDNRDDLAMTLRSLRKANLTNRVHAARDGAEAAEFAFCQGVFAGRKFGNPSKTIWMDLKLPGIDGMEALSHVKDDARTKIMPVVILTSSKEPGGLGDVLAAA